MKKIKIFIKKNFFFNNDSPLHCAVYENQFKVVDLLIKNKVNMNLLNENISFY